MEQYLTDAFEVKVAIHPIENGTAQQEGQCNFHRIAQKLLHDYKGTTFYLFTNKIHSKFDKNQLL